jgi:nicotinamide riboside kinase
MLVNWMLIEREVELPWAADSCRCAEKQRTRVTINCWYQRRCGKVGVQFRWGVVRSAGAWARLRHCVGAACV